VSYNFSLGILDKVPRRNNVVKIGQTLSAKVHERREKFSYRAPGIFSTVSWQDTGCAFSVARVPNRHSHPIELRSIVHRFNMSVS